MNAIAAPELSIEALETGRIDAGTFDHEGHIYLAWLYLDQYPLTDAIARFKSALKRLTIRLGVPGKYHETVSWMFMLLIAERRDNATAKDWFSFRHGNDDLFAGGIDFVQRYYSKELLWSDRARQSFVLPDRLAD
jgi:N-formylglutamate deformylase